MSSQKGNIENAVNIESVKKTLKLWLWAKALLPWVAILLGLFCISLHGKIASMFPNQSILILLIILSMITAGSIWLYQVCKCKSGALYKSVAVLPVLSEKYQTSIYRNTGDYQDHLRHAIIEGNVWKKAVINDYFDGINDYGHRFECFDVRLKFNAIVVHGNMFKGHVVIIDMPYRLASDPIDILHKTLKTEGHRQIRNLSALKNAGFALRFEVSYTDADVLERINKDTNGIKLKVLMQESEKQTVKLSQEEDQQKPVKPLDEIITESFAQKLIDIENDTNELVSIHIEKDKMYISMASFCDIFEPHVLDLLRSSESIERRIKHEMKAIDGMIELFSGDC